jgi:hypothetical protein
MLLGHVRADLDLRYGDDLGAELFGVFLTAYKKASRSVRRARSQATPATRSDALADVRFVVPGIG